MPRIVTRPVIDSIASVTRLSWRSVVLSRHWLRHAKTMIISGMGGCSLCRVLSWGIHSLHVAQPSCLISVLAKVLRKGVWLKYCLASRCLAMRVAEQATEALPPHHVPCLATNCPLPRDQLVIETLMIALRMIVGQVLLNRIRQGTFPQHDHLLQGLLLNGAYEPF